jgi:tetratricopeptide (TPR) repeat protein
MQPQARHRAARLRVGVLAGRATALVIATLTLAPQARAADGVRQVELDADNVRTSVQVIDTDLKNAIAKERRYPLDRRFFEAQMAYERGNLATASVQFVDLVNNPEFQVSRDYGEALFMLGDCLFRQRNYMGAKRYLDQVLRSPTNKNYQGALQELADIAVRLHHMEEVETYAKQLDTIPPGQRKSELLYQFGRSFFSGRAFDRARGLLDSIPRGEKRWPHARFYIGAIQVAQGKPDLAIKEFQDVVDAGKTQDAARRPEQEVLDYAHVALGRLYLQVKKYDDAVFHYQAVDRNSPLYEEALFEMAATHVAANKPKNAIEALDVLLLTVSDDNVAVQAAVLRGRINMLSKQYDQADAAYQDVVERYSAITGELTRFASSDKNLEQFFTWLLNRSSDEYTVVRPVSERVAKYIEHDDDMQRVVALFDDMSTERADVKESARLASTIEAALKESSRLDMFPELKDAWMRVIENQNRTVDIGRRILELLRSFALPRMNAEEKQRADALRAERMKWEAAFAKVPATKGAYVERQNGVEGGYARLSGDVGTLKTALEQVRQQVLAVEKMLNDRVFGDQGVVLDKKKEEEIRTALQAEKDNLRRTYRDIDTLGQDVEVYAQGVGAGDKVSDDEAAVRARLAAAQKAEQEMYVGVLERASEHTDDSTRLRTARNGLDNLGQQMHAILTIIAGRATERVAGVKQILAAEQRNIAEYQVTVRTYEDDSRSMAREVGYGLIRAAEKRLADILLEADLGLVDVAWQRKQDKATAIKELQEERSSRIKSLGDVLRNLTAPTSEGEEP